MLLSRIVKGTLQLSMVFSLCVYPSPSVSGEEVSRSTFDDLLAKTRRLDPGLDFGALRYSYTETPSYSPYDPDVLPAVRGAIAAFNAGEHKRALELVDSVLSKDPVNLAGHIWAAIVCEKLGMGERGRYHQYLADGIVKSILESGDGTVGRPYRVISDIEQFVMLDRFGVDPTRTLEVLHGIHHLNHYDVKSRKDGSELVILFNIDLQYPHKPRTDD